MNQRTCFKQAKW